MAIVLAGLLFLLAVILLARGEVLVAGVCFFSISLLLYFRETRLT